jgi:hypothetical protein
MELDVRAKNFEDQKVRGWLMLVGCGFAVADFALSLRLYHIYQMTHPVVSTGMVILAAAIAIVWGLGGWAFYIGSTGGLRRSFGIVTILLLLLSAWTLGA